MEEEEPTQEYVKGFNQGYVMSKLEPDLIASIITSQPESIKSEYVLALIEGKKQYDLEQKIIQDELKRWENEFRINPKLDSKDRQTDYEL